MYRRQREVNVSHEYLESVCEWLQEWAEKKTSMVIAQFCSDYGIGFSYLKHFVYISPRLSNIYETTMATLCVRWLDFAMKTKDVPSHMQKVLMKYLRAYDHHSFDMELEAKREIAREEISDNHDYIKEDYSKEELDGVYKLLYDNNINKC